MKCSVIKYSNHAIEFMGARGIKEQEVEQVIINGETIEEYPNDRPLPSKLIFGLVNERPMHIVLAHQAETGTCVIVTAYEPDFGKFESDYKTRKKKP